MTTPMTVIRKRTDPTEMYRQEEIDALLERRTASYKARLVLSTGNPDPDALWTVLWNALDPLGARSTRYVFAVDSTNGVALTERGWEDCFMYLTLQESHLYKGSGWRIEELPAETPQQAWWAAGDLPDQWRDPEY